MMIIDGLDPLLHIQNTIHSYAYCDLYWVLTQCLNTSIHTIGSIVLSDSAVTCHNGHDGGLLQSHQSDQAVSKTLRIWLQKQLLL